IVWTTGFQVVDKYYLPKMRHIKVMVKATVTKTVGTPSALVVVAVKVVLQLICLVAVHFMKVRLVKVMLRSRWKALDAMVFLMVVWTMGVLVESKLRAMEKRNHKDSNYKDSYRKDSNNKDYKGSNYKEMTPGRRDEGEVGPTDDGSGSFGSSSVANVEDAPVAEYMVGLVGDASTASRPCVFNLELAMVADLRTGPAGADGSGGAAGAA
ncbi:unnamed protein product, partial [Prorocentrum cordatum]